MDKLRRIGFAAFLGLFAMASQAFAAGEGWSDNYAEAKKTAAAEGKDMLLDFTGSDWCGPCIRLGKEVFQQDAFMTYAKENLVLVEIDYPRDKSKQSEAVQTQNEELRIKFAVRGYPTIILADEQGRPYAMTSYRAGGPENYIKHLQELKQARAKRDQYFDAGQKAEGVERARQLHQGLQAVGDELAVVHYRPIVKQIIQIDAENQLGLKKHYTDVITAHDYTSEFHDIMMNAYADGEGPKAAIVKLEAMIAKDDLPTDLRQQCMATIGQFQLGPDGDKQAAKAILLQAIEVDPDSDLAERIRKGLKRFFPEEE